MTDKELMQQALGALEKSIALTLPNIDLRNAAIAALKSRLEQPEDEPVAHSVIAGVLFDFMGWLTSRTDRLVLSSADEASPAVEAITEFAKMRSLSLDNAQVQNWHTRPQPTVWVGLTEDDVNNALYKYHGWREFAAELERLLKEKNYG